MSSNRSACDLLPARSFRWLFAASALVALTITLLAQPAPAGFTVTNCAEADLISAVNIGGIVALACDGTITISRTLTISADLTLNASGHNVIINGGNSNRIFRVNRGVTLTLKGLTLANGRSGDNQTNSIPGVGGSGGAIFNDGGVVILEDCILFNHLTLGSNGANGDSAVNGEGRDGDDGGSGKGGAIFNNGGVLLITRTAFSRNSATGGQGGNGGGGSESGNGNDGGDGGNGGVGLGGAIYNTSGGVLEMFDSTFANNQVAGASGGSGGTGSGALGFAGSPGSSSIGGGGAIFNESGRVTVNNCTFSANSCFGAAGNGGNLGVGARNGFDGRKGSGALGAALFNDGGACAITNATFFANVVVGGNGGNGGGGGGTGFGGDGGSGGEGGNANGAGFYNRHNGTASLVNCTFSSNNTLSGVGGAVGVGGGFAGRSGQRGGDGLGSGGGIFNEEGTVTLKNTVLAYTEGGGNCGGITSDGGNNISSDGTCKFQLKTSLNSVNPKLVALADNGGTTSTVALLSGSPAIDAGNDSVAPSTDQRRAKRSGVSDIGAFEFNGRVTGFSLDARLEQTNLVLAWPTFDSRFILEMADDLSLQAVWSAVTNQPIIVNNQNTLTLGATNQSRYFRLKKP